MIKLLQQDFKDLYLNIKSLNINKCTLFLILINTVICNVLNLINPFIFGKILNNIIDQSIQDIKLNLINLAIIFIITTILNYINSIMLLKVTYDLEINVKNKLFFSIFKLSYFDFLNINKSKIINSIEKDSSIFSNLISNNINIFIGAINMIISIVIMFYISPLLTLLMLITFPINSIIFVLFGKKIKSIENKYKDEYDNFLLFLNESIYGWKYLKLFNSENKRFFLFEKILKEIYKLQLNIFKKELVSEVIISIVSFLASTLNILLAIYLIFNGNLTLGMFTAFNSYGDTFKNTSLMFARLNSTIQKMSISMKRINDILDCADETNNSQEMTIQNKRINTIKIENLNYSNPDNVNILKNININFEKSNIYVLKGESGSGKTTLLNILCKFIENYKGNIFINNKNLKDINYKSLRSNLSYITQDNYLFSLSIKDNISLYRNVDFEVIKNVCKTLNIHDTIMSLPNNYDTIINKDGVDLSGGERQRLCIARAIISNPSMYLFDEITSAVDKKNCLEVIDIIEKISQNSIVILVSHDNLNFSVPIIEYSLENKTINKKVVYPSVPNI
ncbi:ABC transporter ATP-binding protein (plasmid) [Paraclostridium bifermentans]|uniref:ABC transporter ATP-binding protein n=1 Tax=Paraclostridium bifermentans TaxID=1490 RepID=A0ABY8RB54_PARBF|nr:ABC transporter ATP-binding protein [Paraclostridium bifermentans]